MEQDGRDKKVVPPQHEAPAREVHQCAQQTGRGRNHKGSRLGGGRATEVRKTARGERHRVQIEQSKEPKKTKKIAQG